MRLVLVLLLAAGLAASCKPKPPSPPPADTTGVDTLAPRPDSIAVDSSDAALPDTADVPTCLGCGPEDIDTTFVPDSLRDTPRRRTLSYGQHGLLIGLTDWPQGLRCSGIMSAAYLNAPPEYIAGMMREAGRCDLEIFYIVPRRYLTTNHENKGRFSLANAKAVIDRYARAIPADTAAKYRMKMIPLDDMGCAACWGGTAITQDQASEFYRYAHTLMPATAFGIRGDPAWALRGGNWDASLAFGWAQFHTRKYRGDQRAYYDAQANAANRLGIKLAMGVNVEDCNGPGTSPCTPDQLRRYVGYAITRDDNCAAVSWTWAQARWSSSSIRSAWSDLAAKARARPYRDCRRA